MHQHVPMIREVILFSLLLASCGDDGGESNVDADSNGAGDSAAVDVMPASGPIEVELGLGINSFTEVVENQDVMLIWGPQGGYHINVAIKLGNVNPVADGEIFRLKYEAFLNNKRVSLQSSGASVKSSGLVRARQDVYRFGDRIFFDKDDGLATEGKMLRLGVTLTSETQGESSDEATIVAHPEDVGETIADAGMN